MISNAAQGLHAANRVARRAITRRRRPHALILLYHRIGTPTWDPWGICVSPQRFERHLAMLSQVADVVPLSVLDSQLRVRRRGRPVVALTFDDGYADNLHVALPLLERYGAPATVFVATAWIDRSEPFWWDRLSEVMQSIKRLPARIALRIGDEEFIWERKQKGDVQGGERRQLHSAMWSRLRVATDDEREVTLTGLEDFSDREPEVDPFNRPMTRTELRQMAASPLVEIGAHTMSHCMLPELSAELQRAEIIGSRQQCLELTGDYPSGFAYPFGGLDTDTPGLVRSAGFDRAYSTDNELVWECSDQMLLPRVGVRNYSIQEFSARFRMAWLP